MIPVLLVAVGGLAILVGAKAFAKDLLTTVILLAISGPFVLTAASLAEHAAGVHPMGIILIIIALVLFARPKKSGHGDDHDKHGHGTSTKRRIHGGRGGGHGHA